MNAIYADRPVTGGQVPLLKHAVMLWLQEQAKAGRIHGDTYTLADATKASVTNVHRALWDLQKIGLLTFIERKGEGTNGHGSTTVLTHFVLTDRGKAWEPREAAVTAFAEGVKADDLNPVLTRQWDAEIIADAILDKTPAQAAADLLRQMPDHVMRVVDANIRLGYAKGSTALYSIAKSHPTAFAVKNGKVQFIGPEDWTAPAGGVGVHGHRHRKPAEPEVVVTEQPVTHNSVMDMVAGAQAFQAEADAAGYGRPQEPADPSLVVHLAQRAQDAERRLSPELGPEITALMAREERRQQVAIAATALEAAGLEDDALMVMGRIPDDSPLEQEIIALVRSLR